MALTPRPDDAADVCGAEVWEGARCVLAPHETPFHLVLEEDGANFSVWGPCTDGGEMPCGCPNDEYFSTRHYPPDFGTTPRRDDVARPLDDWQREDLELLRAHGRLAGQIADTGAGVTEDTQPGLTADNVHLSEVRKPADTTETDAGPIGETASHGVGAPPKCSGNNHVWSRGVDDQLPPCDCGRLTAHGTVGGAVLLGDDFARAASDMGGDWSPAPQGFAPRDCPDQGRCFHQCGKGPCFRVLHAGPASGVFPGDTWPEDIHRQAVLLSTTDASPAAAEPFRFVFVDAEWSGEQSDAIVVTVDGDLWAVTHPDVAGYLRREKPELVRAHPTGAVRVIRADDAGDASITCPKCGRTSWNPNDIRQKWCGNCYAYHSSLLYGIDKEEGPQ